MSGVPKINRALESTIEIENKRKDIPRYVMAKQGIESKEIQNRKCTIGQKMVDHSNTTVYNVSVTCLQA